MYTDYVVSHTIYIKPSSVNDYAELDSSVSMTPCTLSSVSKFYLHCLEIFSKTKNFYIKMFYPKNIGSLNNTNSERFCETVSLNFCFFTCENLHKIKTVCENTSEYEELDWMES